MFPFESSKHSPALDFVAPHTLVVRPHASCPPHGRVVLLHGATPRIHHLGGALAGVAPGIWSVAGTAVRLARQGFEVFVPEAEGGAGRYGEWLSRVQAWVGYGPVHLVGFSFGGSSAVFLMERGLHLDKLNRVVLLDPALRNLGSRRSLARVTHPFTVLFAGTFRSRGRARFAKHPMATVQHVVGTKHRHFAQPLGAPGEAYAVFDPGVNRAHRALEEALGVYSPRHG